MARPTTKNDLIELANSNFEKLWQIIDTFTEKEFSTEFDFSANPKLKEGHWKRDKNIRDVLIHLYEWHQLLLLWVHKNTSGEKTNFLPKPYNWKTYGDMNIAFWNKHQETPYSKSIKLLKSSHNEVIELINSFSNEALFTNKHFSWTGTTSLGSYCISATSSHYDWAIKKLKKHKNRLK